MSLVCGNVVGPHLLRQVSVYCTDLRPTMGELKADTVVTMHVLVRPAPVGKPLSELFLEHTDPS